MTKTEELQELLKDCLCYEISYNRHKTCYEKTINEAEEEYYEWVSEEEKQFAIENDSIWNLHSYPNTPVGFFNVTASSLEAIVEYLKVSEDD